MAAVAEKHAPIRRGLETGKIMRGSLALLQDGGGEAVSDVVHAWSFARMSLSMRTRTHGFLSGDP